MEKSRKWRWLVKKAKNGFKSKPYNAGKTLPDPKCYVNLRVEQEDLDQHKSSSLININYNVPLADLERLSDKPPLQKYFPTNCFFWRFLTDIRYLHGKMHQHLGLMKYPINTLEIHLINNNKFINKSVYKRVVWKRFLDVGNISQWFGQPWKKPNPKTYL